MSSDPDQVAALGALYQAERSDGAAMQGANLAILALAVTYAGATAVFLSSTDAQESVNAWVFSFLPLPLWIITLYSAVFSCVQGRRALSGIILERKLTKLAKIEGPEAEAVGLRGSEKLFDMNRGGLLVRIGLGLIYTGGFVLAVLYTTLMLFRAHQSDSQLLVWFLPVAIYLPLAGVIIVTVISHDRERQRLANITGTMKGEEDGPSSSITSCSNRDS